MQFGFVIYGYTFATAMGRNIPPATTAASPSHIPINISASASQLVEAQHLSRPARLFNYSPELYSFYNNTFRRLQDELSQAKILGSVRWRFSYG